MGNNKTVTILGGIAVLFALPAFILFAVVVFIAPSAHAELQTCNPGTGAPAPGGGGGTVKPVAEVDITSDFGPRNSPCPDCSSYHEGLDLGGAEGTPIYAFAKGVVVQAGPSDYGHSIVIDHKLDTASDEDKKKDNKVSTLYGHMYASGVLVHEGEKVKAGQEIAKIGADGNVTGAHLHFGYYPGGWNNASGNPVDPQPYVEAARPPKSVIPDERPIKPLGNDSGGDGGSFSLPKPDGPGEQGGTAGPIPSNYLSAYKAAGKKYGVPWQLLAGIGWAETKHGGSDLPGVHSGENEAGAGGPMQFLEGTWDQYGVDGNGDGRKNRYDIGDAAFGAANYLVASGVKEGTQGVWDALYAYNHLHAYANDVLSYAWDYANGDIEVAPPNGGGQCQPGTGVLSNGGDTSPGTHGYKGKPKLNWPPESATVDDPTTGGKITPRMKAVLEAIEKSAPSKPASKGCWRPSDPYPDHPGGYACDLMFTPANTKKNIDAGWAMANWLVANQKVLGVKYVIWQGKIWTAYKEPHHWRPYTESGCPDPAQVTVCHYDHVHVTVY